jgi:hypothetical protein
MVLFAALLAGAAPLAVSGAAVDATGQPLSGPFALSLTVHEGPPTGAAIANATASTEIRGGFWAFEWSPAVPASAWAGAPWLRVSTGAVILEDRPIAAAPSALSTPYVRGPVEATALRLDGAPVRVTPTAACVAGSRGALRFLAGTNGSGDRVEVCAADASGTLAWRGWAG